MKALAEGTRTWKSLNGKEQEQVRRYSIRIMQVLNNVGIPQEIRVKLMEKLLQVKKKMPVDIIRKWEAEQLRRV